VLKIGVGISRHRPVAFLVAFVLVSLVVLAIKWSNLPLRSAKGDEALEKLRRRNAALETTVRRRGGEVDVGSLLLAVALFGPRLLASGELAWMHEGFVTRHQNSTDSSGGGSCSGGCGGGCGGCGG
jgi:hypothetical protein